MATTIWGIFSDQSDADNMVKDLVSRNYPTTDISVLVKEGVIKDTGEPNMLENVATRTVGGATAGTVVGGIAGLLVGLGALAIPGFGAVLIGGPVAAALGVTGATATTVSAAATGAFAGGLLGALGAIGLPSDTVKVYEEQIKSGGIVMSVTAADDEESDEVKALFEEHGAVEIQEVDR